MAKPTHINLSTTPDAILATMRKELAGARYQKRKAYGNARQYEAWKQAMKEKALREKKSLTSGITEWTSPTGNHWLMYSHWEYLPKVNRVLSTHAAFIFYETFGSCGAFFPTFPYGERKPSGVIIFTSHFFLRRVDRTDVQSQSKEMIQEFMNSDFIRSVTGQNKIGGDVYMRFHSGYGEGKTVCLNPLVVEMRTFLNEKELTKAQRKRLQCADYDGRIIQKLGDTASPETLKVLQRSATIFASIAQAWNGFDTKKYDMREVVCVFAEAMPDDYFGFAVNGKTPTRETGNKFIEETINTLIKVAEHYGYTDWEPDRVLDAMHQIAVKGYAEKPEK